MRSLAWLLLACPALALAQDAPPPPDQAYPPPPDAYYPPPDQAYPPLPPDLEPPPPPPGELIPLPPPPPPPVAHEVLVPQGGQPQSAPVAQRSSGPHRGSWYIGFGVGSGAGWASDATGQNGFEAYTYSGDRSTLTFNFNVGATLTPNLLLGGELGAFGTSGTAYGYDSSIVASYLDAVLTWFPVERGVFLRGGAGIAGLQTRLDSAAGTVDTSSSGGDVLAGVGYAWWLGKSFNLVAQLDGVKAWYNGTVSSSETVAFTLGFEWY